MQAFQTVRRAGEMLGAAAGSLPPGGSQPWEDEVEREKKLGPYPWIVLCRFRPSFASWGDCLKRWGKIKKPAVALRAFGAQDCR